MDQYNYTPDPFNRSAQAVTTLVSNAMKRVYFKMTVPSARILPRIIAFIWLHLTLPKGVAPDAVED